jgi:hypothetical protein
MACRFDRSLDIVPDKFNIFRIKADAEILIK